MFVVTLPLNEVLGWTRAQAGTSSPRAIVYMDEVFGYFPPVAKPPSKRPVCRQSAIARGVLDGMEGAARQGASARHSARGVTSASSWNSAWRCD